MTRRQGVRQRCVLPWWKCLRRPGASGTAGSPARCIGQWQRWQQESSVGGGFSWCVSSIQRTGFAAGAVPWELCFSLGALFLQQPWPEYQINGTAQHHLFELRVFLGALAFCKSGDSAALFATAVQPRRSTCPNPIRPACTARKAGLTSQSAPCCPLCQGAFPLRR